MRFAALVVPVLAALPTINAALAADAFSWAADIVSGESAAPASKEIHIMDSWAYEDCGSPTDAVQLKSISVFPDPPVPGENLTVVVEADVLERIEDGATADVTVKIGLVKILQKTFDVCQEAEDADAEIQCPVEPGSYTISQTVELPKEIPKAKFKVSVFGYTVDEEDMLCLDLSVDFSKKW